MNHAAVREVADLYFDRFTAHLEGRLTELRNELRNEFRTALAALRDELKGDIARLDRELANQRADLIKWMFIFWAGTVAPLAGLMIAVLVKLWN